jgi:ATP-dependent helicase/nuclease subunit A
VNRAGAGLEERDLETRRLAQSEFERPLIVVAGAGTGKTALLVARVIAWCVGPGWSRHETTDRPPEAVARLVVERVSAITFTEAAAAEMARKIGEALVRLASLDGDKPVGWDPDPDRMPSDRALALRATALAQEAHRLKVSTIHGFCQRLLRTNPLEAGVHPHFQVDPDGTRLDETIAAVVEEALRGLEGDPARPCWERLAADGFGPPRVAKAVRQLIDNGVSAAALQRDPFDTAAVRAAAERLQGCAEALLAAEGGRLQGVRAPKSVATLEAVSALVGSLRRIGGTPTLDELIAAVRQVGHGARDRLKDWAGMTLGKREGERLAGVESALAIASGDLLGALEGPVDAAPAALAAARAVLAPLVEEVERRRCAAGVVTFSDQLRCADALLDGSPGVRREVRAGIDQLLVDEFQDTDEVQCRIVRRLALDGPVAARPGLFVVGDPKQSIYAWRNADLRAYDHFVELVRRNHGRIEPLVRNFRSFQPILDEVAAVVGPMMREEHGVQPAFEPLQATDGRVKGLGFSAPPWTAVEHWVAWPTGDEGPPAPVTGKDRPANELEAQALADDIRRLHDDGGVGWKDVAVLLRATTGQEGLLKAFRERGVPYEVAREREYFRRREVVEAAALVRCVLEPTDTLALLTVLRSDVVGVPDAALAPLWDEGLPSRMARLAGGDAGSLAAALEVVDRAAAHVDRGLPGPASLPSWPQALRAAVAAVAELRRSLRVDAPDIFVERIRTLWLAEVTAAARFLRQAVADGAVSTVTAEPDRDADAVHVMTIHGAKGLDFGHVYVVQTHRGGRGGGAAKEAEVGHIEKGRLEYRLFGWQTLGFGAVRRLAVRQEHAERVRLLYVAMTRAKERLVISGAWKSPGRVVDPLVAGNFADLLAGRGDLEALESQAAAGESRRAGLERCVKWVLPALVDRDVAASGRAGRDVVTSDLVALVRRDSERLAGVRVEAAARMARPLVGAASSLAHALFARQDAEDDVAPGSDGNAGGSAATAIGSAVHRLLERLDLERDTAPQIAALGERARAEVVNSVGPSEAAEAVSRLDDLIDTVAGGACLARLAEVADRVAARELPVLVRADDEALPIAAISGVVDLVYRDPDDGRVVVGDYKTDRIVDEPAMADRVAIYEPQVRTYAKALRQALSLDHEPHVELWFLDADKIIRLKSL